MSDAPPAAVPAPLANSSSSGKLSTLKTVSNPFQREIVAPDKYPRVRWHTARYVMICRNSLEVVLFAVFALFAFLIGPSLVSFMYPNVILPFAPALEWKCTPINTYIHIHPNNLVLETNLLAAASAVKIQIYLGEKTTTFEDLEKILLVIDDCAFDHYGKNVMLCQPYLNSDSRPTFDQYIKMAENCYHYIRQITREAKISAYGKGITANVLLAAAARLRKDSCFHFDKLYLEDPIPDIKTEFEKSSWIGMAYMLPALRDKLISDAIIDHGLDNADLATNMNLTGSTAVYILPDQREATSYSELKPQVKIIEKKEFDQEIAAQVPNPPVNKPFQFRHAAEEECASALKKPVTRLHIPY